MRSRLLPLVWRWQSFPSAFLLATLGYLAINALTDRDFATDVELAALRFQVFGAYAGLAAALLGSIVNTAMLDVRQSSLGWTLPGIEQSIRREVLLCAGVVVPVMVALLGALGSPADHVALVIPYAMLSFALFASWHQIVMGNRISSLVGLAPYVAIVAIALSGAGPLAATVRGLSWPGALSAFVISAALIWYVSSESVQRRIIAAKPPLNADPAVAEHTSQSSPPSTLWQWIRQLSHEDATRGIAGFDLLLPGRWYHVTNALLFGLAIFFFESSAFLLGFAAVHGWIVGAYQLWYPLSRTARARIQFAEQLQATILVGLVTALLHGGLWWLDVPTVPFFRRDVMLGIPLAVEFAAAIALFPVGQLGRVLVPLKASAEVSGKMFALQMSGLLLLGVGAALTAKGLWTATNGDIANSLLIATAIAVAMQVANWWYLHAVFARRSLAHH